MDPALKTAIKGLRQIAGLRPRDRCRTPQVDAALIAVADAAEETLARIQRSLARARKKAAK